MINVIGVKWIKCPHIHKYMRTIADVRYIWILTWHCSASALAACFQKKPIVASWCPRSTHKLCPERVFIKHSENVGGC